MTFGLTGSGLWVLGLGTVLAFLGVALLSPLVSRPVTGALGSLFSRRLPGRLGRQNSQRNPRRTASTAAALMIGLALVSRGRRARRVAEGERAQDRGLRARRRLHPQPDRGRHQRADRAGGAAAAGHRRDDRVQAGGGAVGLGRRAVPDRAAGLARSARPSRSGRGRVGVRPRPRHAAGGRPDVAEDQGLSVGSTVPAQLPGRHLGAAAGGRHVRGERPGRQLRAGRQRGQPLRPGPLHRGAGEGGGRARTSGRCGPGWTGPSPPYPNVQLQDRSEFVGDITRRSTS